MIKSYTVFLDQPVNPQYFHSYNADIHPITNVIDGFVRYSRPFTERNKTWFFLNTEDPNVIDTLQGHVLTIGGLPVSIEEVRPRKFPLPIPDSASEVTLRYLTLSPIVILDDNMKYFTIKEGVDKFENTLSEMLGATVKVDIDYVHRMPDRLVKIISNVPGIKRFPATVVPLIITTSPEKHKDIWLRGIGDYAEYGFGYIEVFTGRPNF
jgi:hypothetical protein